MIHRTVRVNQWDYEFYISQGHYWAGDIMRSLDALEAPDSILRQVGINLEKYSVDTGFTYSNPKMRKSIIVIGRCSNGAEFINSFTHELRHAVDDTARADGMHLAGEPVAYLSGDIAYLLSDVICRMSCDRCRHL